MCQPRSASASSALGPLNSVNMKMRGSMNATSVRDGSTWTIGLRRESFMLFNQGRRERSNRVRDTGQDDIRPALKIQSTRHDLQGAGDTPPPVQNRPRTTRRIDGPRKIGGR